MLKLLASTLCAVIFTSACTVQNLSEKTTLAANEGVLVTTVHCSRNINWFEFYETGKVLNDLNHMFISKEGSSGCSNAESELKMIKVREGSYYIGVVGGGQSSGTIPEKESVSFQIEAGKANYIGDLQIVSSKPVDTGLNATTVYFSFRVVDAAEQTKAALNSEYPWLLTKYEFVTLLANSPSGQANSAISSSKGVP